MKNNLIRNFTFVTFLVICFSFQNSYAQSYSLYGVTQYGGTYNKGVIYRYDYPSGNDTVILNFNDTNGALPLANLIEASDGNLYGTASEGGTSNDGVFYCINPHTYEDTVLISFHGTNGSTPHNAILQASNGLLYGLTFKGGAYGKGLCYSYDIATKTQTALFSFDGTNGAYPAAYFIQASNGFLIGHTKNGGAFGDGTLFYYNITTGHDSVLVDFDGTNGSIAIGGLFEATNGLIYGTTQKGGSGNYGVLYSYDLATRTLTDLFSFNGTNGIYPSANRRGLFQSSSGLLYGLIQMGGTYNNGLMYSYDINTAKDSVLINFSSSDTLGNNPYTVGFIQISNGGELITPMDSGGVNGLGTLMAFNPATGGFRKLLDFNNTNGAYPTNALTSIQNQVEEGINRIKNNSLTNLYPNPNNGLFTITSPVANDLSLIKVYNMLGMNIYTETLPCNKGENVINIGSQPKGIYLYRLTSKDGSEVSSGKFIIE